MKDLPLRLLNVMLVALLLSFAGTLGVLAGYQDGTQQVASIRPVSDGDLIREQFDLGVQDYQAGRYDLARQRFEYVIALAPGDYPLAWDLLEEILAIQNATVTFTSLPPIWTSTPTITITPTHDLSGVDSIFSRAQSLLAAGDWDGAIEALIVLRDEELYYRVVEVDDSLFVALRNRGEQKILLRGDLEGGIYDLTLAERFGPLDYSASVYRDWARLYLSALGYWEAYPEQAAYYFGQIAAAMPGLRDSSGWTAMERYRQSLIDYGDKLAVENRWCEAQARYEAALAINRLEEVALTLTYAAYACSPPTWTFTPSPAPSGSPTITNSPTISPTGASTPTNTQTSIPTISPSPSVIATSTSTIMSTDTPSPLPTATDIPAPPMPTTTPTPLPSETPSPISTETPTTP
ncbi:MAG: hypothetical protein FJ010_07490 [Chloroflexi bacterium]|nr:hypothetical protein [Chloroflexota bacterium]